MSSSNHGPSRQQMRTVSGGGGISGSSSSSAQHHQHSDFTAEMRDRQARGKDPYTKERRTRGLGKVHVGGGGGAARGGGGLRHDGSRMDIDYEEAEDEDDDDNEDNYEDDDDGMDEGRTRMRIGAILRRPKNESFEEREKKQFALSVLDSPEQLMMYAQSTNDSIPGQRFRFMSVLCGFGEPISSETQRKQLRPVRRH